MGANTENPIELL